MKRSRKWITIWTVLALMAGFTGTCLAVPSSTGNGVGSASIREQEFAAGQWTSRKLAEAGKILDLEKAVREGQPLLQQEDAFLLKKGETLVLPFSTEKEGSYQLYFQYKVNSPKVMENQFDFSVDDKEYLAMLPVLWADAQDQYKKDSYGNELVPEQAGINQYFYSILQNARDIGKEPLTMELSAGEHRLSLTAGVQDIQLKAVYLTERQPLYTYAEYCEAQKNANAENTDLIVVEGEKYAAKSDSFIRGGTEPNPSLYPYSSNLRVINTLDQSSWKTTGQKVLWEFEVKADGWYQMGFRYMQDYDTNKASYRTVEIDGEVPFQELEYTAFPQTPNGKYKNLLLQNNQGEAFRVYLSQGTHTIAMRAVVGPFQKAYDDISGVMSEINSLGMNLKKLTAGSTDKDRTWDMDVYFPEAAPKLSECAIRIREIYDYLKSIDGKKPVYADSLLYAAETLEKLAKEPRVLPNKTDLLNVGDNSVSKYLGTVLGKLTVQPLGIDRLYLSGDGGLPSESASVFTSVSEGVKSFAHSFLPNQASANYAASGKRDGDELTVWVNRPIQYVQVLQEIVDAEYNQKYGANVQLSIMPNEQKLILSNASKTNPDVALGVNYYTPFDFAIRGAAKDLTQYPDFLDFYSQEYNMEALTPMFFNDGVYGATETQDFQVLFYRKDILASLGLEAPDTWDDVKEMMPVLLRYSMNFNIPVANVVGFKSFQLTAPFVYQNGGALFAQNGMASAITTEQSIQGFAEMTDLFNIYGAKQYVPSFYNSFRFGETPVGISGFTTYMQLQVAAPELAGQWGVALAPGVRQEDGSVLRYQMADSTACMIFENTKKSEEAWRFVKWWLSKDTQLKYAYTLQSSFGPEFRWNTANRLAFEELPYPEEHRKVILEQWKSQKENLRHPANYMLEREFSNAWNNVVVKGQTQMEAIDKAALTSDREILRKMQEFGFCDENGNILKEYQTNAVERLYAKLAEGSNKDG